jgi:hypothetical protein
MVHAICKFQTASELLFSLFSWTGISQEVYYATSGTSVGSTAGVATSGQTFYALPTSSGSDGSSTFRSPSPVYGPPAPLVTSDGVSSSSFVSTAQGNIRPQTSLAAYSTPATTVTSNAAAGFAGGSSNVAGASPSGIQEHSVAVSAPSLPSQVPEFPSVSTAAAGDFYSAGTGNVVDPAIPVSDASSFTVLPAAAEAVGCSSFAGPTYSESQGNTGIHFSPVHSYALPTASHLGSVKSSVAGALSAVQTNAGDNSISISSYIVPSSAPGGAESNSFAGTSTQETTGYAEVSFSPATSYSAPEATHSAAATSSFSGHVSSAVQQNLGDNFAPGASHGALAATSAAFPSAQGHTVGVSFVPFAVQHSYGINRLQ